MTKEGALAGPRVLEHLVDTVLYFEGDGAHALRVLRAVKNRFGSTNEVGVFEMGERGLAEVRNPSAAFLAERPVDAPGSAVLATLEGSRPVLVEIQALVSRSGLAMPRRTAIGVDAGRVALLLAVLEKRRRMQLHDQDVFLNVAGGLRVDEPAADLAVVAAVASSVRGRPLPDDAVLWGEVGLTGEVRSVGAGRGAACARRRARDSAAACCPPATSAACGPSRVCELTGVAALDALFEVARSRMSTGVVLLILANLVAGGGLRAPAPAGATCSASPRAASGTSPGSSIGVITLMDELTSVFYAPAEAHRFIGTQAIFFIAFTSLLMRLLSSRMVEIAQILERNGIRGGGVYSFSYLVLGPVASFVAVASIMVDYILTACISTVSAVINGTAFLPLSARRRVRR